MNHGRYIGVEFAHLHGKTAVLRPMQTNHDDAQVEGGWIQAQFDDVSLGIEQPDGTIVSAGYGWFAFPALDFEEVTNDSRH